MDRVLFVDDENLTLKLIERKFKDTNLKCYFAEHASEAVEILKANEIDVLVTDIMMPDTNGLELVNIAKEISPNTVRIVLSGNSQVTSIIEAVNTGHIYKYIVKPWRVDDKAIALVEEAVDYSKYVTRKSQKKNTDIFIDIEDLDFFSKSNKWILADDSGNIIKTNIDDSLPYKWFDGIHSIVRTQEGHLKFYDIK